MRVVFNAVDDQPVVPVDLRREFGIDPDNKIVICVGRLVWFKGHRFLLKSFARLLSKGTAATLILVGEGGERDGLHALARELDISDDVLFIGHDPRGPALAAGADALVLASSYEPFGRVLIEAMSSGVPVIGTACGGIPDIIRHEENGLLVSYDDTEELASAMERLLADEALRERCIRGGSESVKTTFSLRNRTQDIEEIIENTLRNRESAPAFSASTSTGRVP
jgi:glycosyltransferase involved in cell wall biosynthesis